MKQIPAYRVIEKGEIIQDGDHVFIDGKWERVHESAIGSEVISESIAYRRRIWMNEDSETRPDSVIVSPLPFVSRISYGRTYNTGSYTNTRLDVTVDVPPNEKAADVLKQLEQVFTEADPNNAKEDYKVSEAKAVLSMPASLITQEDLGRLAIARRTVAAFEERKKRMATARNLLDHLGAQAVFKDARWTWEDNDEQGIPF